MTKLNRKEKEPLKPKSGPQANQIDYNRVTIAAWGSPNARRRATGETSRSEQQKSPVGSTGRRTMHPGISTLQWLYKENLKVDPEWSEKTEIGFRWWPDKNAQTIEIVGEMGGPDGETGYLVSVRTELLRSLELGELQLLLLNVLLALPSMAGLVYDQQSRTLSLCSLVPVFEDTIPWARVLISGAAVLQIGEARTIGTELASTLKAHLAVSGPQGRGLRPEPDELPNIIPTLIVPMGGKPSQWSAEEFDNTVKRYLRKPPALSVSARKEGLLVEFPFGNVSSQCTIAADEPHPRYGNGCLVNQKFPVSVKSDFDGVRLALLMNRKELMEKPSIYGIGSYCYALGALQLSCFLPNAFYVPNLLPWLYMSCIERARRLSVLLTHADWTQASFSPRRSVVGRLIDRLKGK